jgi:Uma2 family endonuclease
MSAIASQDWTDILPLETDDPEERYITTGVDWTQYETLLDRLENRVGIRVTYLDRTLEIMAPSRWHERRKTNIGMFLEAYFQETRTRFWGFGSTTFRRQSQQGGTEPDECYCLGTEKELPDLVIEVVVTSGGIDKLEVYRRLGIPEVWFWQNERLAVYCLRNGGYQECDRSDRLPELDLIELATYIRADDPLEAVLTFRDRLRQGLHGNG